MQFRSDVSVCLSQPRATLSAGVFLPVALTGRTLLPQHVFALVNSLCSPSQKARPLPPFLAFRRQPFQRWTPTTPGHALHSASESQPSPAWQRLLHTHASLRPGFQKMLSRCKVCVHRGIHTQTAAACARTPAAITVEDQLWPADCVRCVQLAPTMAMPGLVHASSCHRSVFARVCATHIRTASTCEFVYL